MVTRKEHRKKKSKRKLIFKVISVIVLVLLLGTGAFAFNIYNQVKSTVQNKIHETIPTLSNREGPDVSGGEEPINILLMGVDKRPGDSGRSDTMIVLSLNPSTNSMQMISIPRDTRTLIVGKGYKDKINHAYAFGGTDMAVATVENFADIELDYYVKLNMQGLSDMVDAMGGITVNSELSWYDEKRDYQYQKGQMHLNGELTMGFVRMRKQDPRGDFGRNERQRKVIKAIIDKGASISSVTRLSEILNVLGDNVKTNMTFEEMKHIAFNYKDCRKNIKSYEVEGNGTKIDGTYYLIVDEAERQKVHDMIKEFNNKK